MKQTVKCTDCGDMLRLRDGTTLEKFGWAQRDDDLVCSVCVVQREIDLSLGPFALQLLISPAQEGNI